jgi:hypothetical protein
MPAATTAKLSTKTRLAVNKKLHAVGTARYDTLGAGLEGVTAALAAHGLAWAYDNHAVTYNETRRRSFDVTLDGAEVENSVLVVSIYRSNTGRYEVTAYLS